jgi:hypothetical protein
MRSLFYILLLGISMILAVSSAPFGLFSKPRVKRDGNDNLENSLCKDKCDYALSYGTGSCVDGVCYCKYGFTGLNANYVYSDKNRIAANDCNFRKISFVKRFHSVTKIFLS